MKKASSIFSAILFLSASAAFAQAPKENSNIRETRQESARPKEPYKPNVNSQTGGSGPVGYEPSKEYNTTAQDTSRASKRSLSDADKTFAMQASSMDMYEIKAGKFAIVKGHSKEVREYGRMMSKDHTKTSRQLEEICRSKGHSTPVVMMAEENKMYTALEDKKGEEFDKLYIEQMVASHQKAVDTFEKAQATVQDPEMKKFVVETLPALRHHLKSAQELMAASSLSGK